jgi:hypothetical protein
MEQPQHNHQEMRYVPAKSPEAKKKYGAVIALAVVAFIAIAFIAMGPQKDSVSSLQAECVSIAERLGTFCEDTNITREANLMPSDDCTAIKEKFMTACSVSVKEPPPQASATIVDGRLCKVVSNGKCLVEYQG